MKRYRLTATADAQLQDIWRFTCDRWGPDQADRYLRDIDQGLEAAINTPALLLQRPELGLGVVSRRIGSHVVYGVPRGEDLLIIGVLHGAMDPQRHLTPDDT
jgi:toxin ParE1/3/4